MAIQNAIHLTETGIISADGEGGFSGRTITGTTNFIDTANGDGTGGNPTLSIAPHFENTGMHCWNGAIIETSSTTVTSDGATITLAIEKSGGGNLTVVFSDGYYDWVTAPDTVTLTAGTDTTPQSNFVYFPQGTKTLTSSTIGFPSGEHVPVATVICQSAASLQPDGSYKVHAWSDHVVQSSRILQGHLAEINLWIRNQHATWTSGVAQTCTITQNPGAADNVVMTTVSGLVLQLHNHEFPAFSGTPTLYVPNDFDTPYNKVSDLNELLTDSNGDSMAGKFFSLVIWGVVSESAADCKFYCNLPSGSYNNANQVTLDASRYANYTIPSDFKGTAFLITQWNLRHQNADGGTWTSIDEVDLRGQIPSISAGGTNAFPTEFVDNGFRILDGDDTTKEIAFQASGITTFTTRTLTVPDASGTIVLSNVASTDEALARWDGTSGALVQNSNATLSDAGSLALAIPLPVASGGTAAATLTGLLTGNGTSAITANAITEGAVLLGGTSNAVTDTGVLAKGVLLVGNGATAPTELPVGKDDQVLTADAAEASGVKWADAV